jgi:hypothetical protein
MMPALSILPTTFSSPAGNVETGSFNVYIDAHQLA